MKIFSENLQQDTLVYIPSKASIENVKDSLMGNLKNPEAFLWVAKKKKYTSNIRAGKFALKAGMSSHDLINHLRGVRFCFNITVTLLASDSDSGLISPLHFLHL